MTLRVLLVRHSEPLASATTDPASWPLTTAGRRAAVALRRELPTDEALWVSSEEVKAFETLSVARPEPSLEIHLDARLNEVRRPGEPFDDDVISRRMCWVEGRLDERHRTWEAPEDVGRRLASALTSYEGDTDVLVAASHGMAITALLVHVGRIGQGVEAGEFWRRLAMPAVVEIRR